MTVVERPLRIFVIHASHHLTDFLPNGDGLVAWGYISELARRGHQIYAVTDSLDISVPIPENLKLIEIPRTSGNEVVHYLSYMKKVRALYDRIEATAGVDVVHQMNPVIRGLSLALLGRDVPIVLGTYVGDWKRLRSNPKYHRLTPQERLVGAFKAAIDAVQQCRASHLALATPHALSRVPFSRFLKGRIRYLHHGVDTLLFHGGAVKGDPPSRSHSILFLGHVSYMKGASTLIDAFKVVAENLPDAELVFIGSGRIDEMRHRLEGYGLESRALFLGQLPRAEVAGWLRACTVLCAPSFGEPYGQNVLEAMATGKPVVATSSGGHRYLLDADGGYQITPGDTDALAAALRNILNDPIKAKNMGRHNRVLVEQRNTWSHVADELEAIYRSAIASRSRNLEKLEKRYVATGASAGKRLVP